MKFKWKEYETLAVVDPRGRDIPYCTVKVRKYEGSKGQFKVLMAHTLRYEKEVGKILSFPFSKVDIDTISSFMSSIRAAHIGVTAD